MKRICEVCKGNANKPVHSQKFLLPGFRKIFTYDVVSCEKCGFVFADNTPSQKEYDQYYKFSSKYTYHHQLPAGLKIIYKDIYETVSRYINGRNTRILDVGCGIGSLLHEFKNHGYNDIMGLEPSLECCKIAKEIYGINAVPGSTSNFKTNKKFDLVMMTGVLEHVREFDQLIPPILPRLTDNGLLMILVPDAGHFNMNPKCPFDEFSFEHINYFTDKSLANLMARHGLRKIFSKTVKAEFYDSKNLITFFGKGAVNRKNLKDSKGLSRIKRYVASSIKKLQKVKEKITPLLHEKGKIAVWGAGSLTYRLLASTPLLKVNIRCFIDSNTSLQGQKINSIEITSPDILHKYRFDVIFIASYIYGKEIGRTLKTKFKYTGKIIRI